MSVLTKTILAAAGALALTATAASAEIVCNGEGDCWHVKTRHEYRPEFGLHVYPDNWRWANSDAKHYRWREHEGRGYWHNNLWTTF